MINVFLVLEGQLHFCQVPLEGLEKGDFGDEEREREVRVVARVVVERVEGVGEEGEDAGLVLDLRGEAGVE